MFIKLFFVFLLFLMPLQLTVAQQENFSMGCPKYLYKVVSPEEWKESLQKGFVVPSPIDHDFFHLATQEQVPAVIQKFWDQKEYVILKLSPQQLSGRLVYEINPGGSTKYYHLYEGTIPLNAVVESKFK